MRALPAAITVLVAAAVAGCGGSNDATTSTTGSPTSGSVLIESDSGPKGDPTLLKDHAAGRQNARVAITPKGVPTAVYQLRLHDPKPGTRIGALSTVTLSKCAITDYIPHHRQHTACEGTPRYYFDPVKIESRFRLVGGSQESDLDGRGVDVGPSRNTSCTTKLHHCTISQLGEVTLSKADLRGDPRWLVYEVTATSGAASTCDPPKASRCDVLAVETQKGTAMYAVQAEGDPESAESPPVDLSRNEETLPVLASHGNEASARRVVYSVELAPADQIAGLEGDQMEALGRLRIAEQLPQAPLVAGYIVFSDSATGTEGRYLISDSYDSGHTGNAGGNCDRSCAYTRPVAVTRILPCDVSAGRRYINLVAVSARAAAKQGETVDVLGGGFLKVTHYYEAEHSGSGAGAGSASTDCAS